MARVQFEMTQADLDKIMGAIRQAQSTPLIALQCGMPKSVQEVANEAWCELGQRMGFDGMSVQPAGRGGMRFFTAEQV
nr:MAG TPA: hypothetical protein [Caudoviricetes sp.]